MVYNNCALYMLLYAYKQCRGFYCCSIRVVNARAVFQKHHLVIIWVVKAKAMDTKDVRGT